MAFKHHEPLSSAKAIVAFLVLAIVFCIFAVFKMRGQDLANSGQLTTFRVLAILGGMALITLLYLVNNSKGETKVAAKSTKASKSKKKK